MSNKVIRKFKQLYFKYKRILITTSKSYAKSSDVDRWSKSKSLFTDWDERTLLLAQQIKPNSKVFEFGAARLVLREAISDNCVYLHSDIVKRNDETLVFDLNKGLPEVPKVDYIVFSGVLEYIFEVEALLRHLASNTDNFLISYATTDQTPDKVKRRYEGWVSDLNEMDISNIADSIDMTLQIIGRWRTQTLYHISKK